MFASLLLASSSSLLAACPGGSEGISWRTPCAATGEYDDQVQDHFRYEYDEDGHELFSELKDNAGTVIYTITTEWQGDLVKKMSVKGDSYDYTFTTQVENDRYLEIVYDDKLDSTYNFADTYSWDDNGDLERIVTDYANPDIGDVEMTFAKSSGGFSATQCWAQDACDTWLYTGADYVGDFMHYTRVDSDWSTDGTIDARTEVTYDEHDLVLTSEGSYVMEEGGELEPFSRLSYDREEDGTALSMKSETFGEFGGTYELTYAFECEDEGQARERDQLPGIDRLRARPSFTPRQYAPGRAL